MKGRLSEIWWQLLPGSATALVVIALLKLGVWQPLEQLAYVALFNLRGATPWDEQVVVVAIDDTSLRQLGRFPWSRQRYIKLLDVLSQAGPNVVAFDILWSESSPDDSSLAAAVERHGQVVLAEAWDATGTWLQPTQELQAVAIATGHIHKREGIDGITRSIAPQMQGKPALGIVAAQAYSLVQEPVQFPSLDQPLWINWSGPVQQSKHYSFVEVIEGRIPAQAFQNKIIVVGVTASGFDAIATPFNRNPSVGGVYLHAAVIDNLLQHSFLQIPSQQSVFLILLLIGPTFSLLLSHRRLELQALAWIGSCLSWGIFALLLFRAGYWFPAIAPIGLFTGTVSSVALCERLRMNALLQQQVEQLWQAHYQDLVVHRPNATHSILSTLPQRSKLMQRTAQLATLAEEFGRSQSAQAAIARSLSIGLLAVDLDGYVWFCNPVAAEWLQIKLGDRLQPQLFPHWFQEDEWQSDLQNLQAGNSLSSHKLQVDNHWFEIKLEPLFYQSPSSSPKSLTTRTKKLDGLLLSLNDITERQEVEQMKDEFVSIVSHELRTPLTSIRGSLGLLLTGKLGTLSDKGQRMLEIAVNNTDRLVRLINDILDLERIESGKVNLIKQPCDAAALLSQAAEVMQAMAEKANITLSVSTISVSLCADPDRIIQVITNLLSNAIKFSPQASTIWLTTELKAADPEQENQKNVPQSNPSLLIAVKDQGRGIPPEKLETVFGRFQQVDASDARQKGGTGLGLAICYAIVQQHNGNIWVESTMGKGSVFYVTLPTIQKGDSCDRNLD